MTREEAVSKSVRDRPGDTQHEGLAFVLFLRQRAATPRPQRTLRGLWSGTDMTADDIAELRREMWSTVPRADA